MVGGAISGAINGAFEGGLGGALKGAAFGAVAGLVFGTIGLDPGLAAFAMVGGAVYAGVTGGIEGLANCTAGMLGSFYGSSLTGSYSQHINNAVAGRGFVDNKTAINNMLLKMVESGEITWSNVACYFNDPNVDPEVKSELISIMNGRGFNFVETSPGKWQQTWGPEGETLDFVGGLQVKIPANTTVTVEYMGSDVYGISSGKPIRAFWGFDVPLVPKGRVTSMQVNLSYDPMGQGHLTVMRTDMRGSLRKILMSHPWEVK